jgi:UDP-3-O-[3-hydroxymyristoyl] N-acetylglucosamine deacetylase
MQHTLRAPVTITGIGVHSGTTVTARLLPASADHGIVFVRTDIVGKDNVIPARWDNVVDTRLCTVIGNKDGAVVGTIEHLMAALRGCGVDNVLVEINAPEVPILDGSSAPFVAAIEEVGIKVLSAPRRAIRVLKEIVVQDGDKEVRLSPASSPSFSGQIDYNHPDIGSQRYTLKMVNGNFKHDIADCRTFGLLKDVEMMRAAGLALGGSLDNAIVLDDNGIMNPEGLRCADEFIRHKILDAVGDMYLAGGPIIGAYDGMRAGHMMNNLALRALFADPTAWEKVDLFVEMDETESSIYAVKPRASSVAVA